MTKRPVKSCAVIFIGPVLQMLDMDGMIHMCIFELDQRREAVGDSRERRQEECMFFVVLIVAGLDFAGF